jgi:hypothetical protein
MLVLVVVGVCFGGEVMVIGNALIMVPYMDGEGHSFLSQNDVYFLSKAFDLSIWM